MAKMKLIRGARIIQQMKQLDEASYGEIERKTLAFTPPSEKRQWAVDPIQVTSMELVAARESKNLQVNAVVSSDSGKEYQSQMLFDDVIYEDGDQSDNVSFVAAGNDEYHIIPINLNQQNVKVRCTCLDFYWRFAVPLKSANSLLGDSPPPYQKRTDARPDANPNHTPGVCKHLMKVAIALKEAGIVR